MEIMVLSTLHHLHGDVDYYTFEYLSQIIEKFSPEVLAVELTPADLESRREQRIKQEYPKSVYPLLDKLQCKVVPLEPPEPAYSEMVEMGRRAKERLEKEEPNTVRQFGLYVNVLYSELLEWWSSPIDVNATESDRHIEIKHKYQSILFGEDEENGWERWNQHFLEQILGEAVKGKEGKMLVLVGLEHSYWLRKQLASREDIELLDATSILEEMFD